MELWPKIKKALSEGRKLTLEVKSEKRSLDQSSIIHVIITQIARQAMHLNRKWDVDDWKRLLLHLWLKESGDYKTEHIVPALDGSGIVQLGLQTRKMSKDQASEFIEFLYAWSAEHGIDVSKVEAVPQ